MPVTSGNGVLREIVPSGAGIMCAMRSYCAAMKYTDPASSIFRVAGMSETLFAHTGT